MKKITYLLLLSSLTLACNTEEKQKEIIKTESTTKVEDVNTVNATIEKKEVLGAEKEFTYEYFEDYIALTSKEALINAFGVENLRDDTSWYAEGEVMKLTTHLINPHNGNRIRYIWADDNQTTSWIETNHYLWDDEFGIDGTQKIATKAGIYTGMPLSELTKWNEEDFTFSGFGWDYAGNIFAKEESKIFNLAFSMRLMLDQVNPIEGVDHLYGDVELSSASTDVQQAPILVEMLSLHVSEK